MLVYHLNMGMVWKTLVVVLGACAAVALAAVPYVDQIAAVASRREIRVGTQTIIAELVSTPEQMARGLGGRDGIGVNEGMLFSFSAPGVYPFWMKDMRFPIDVVWLRDGRVVGVTENMNPQVGASDAELRTYSPPEPVTHVLELHAGRARLLRAAPGTPVVVRSLL